MTMSEKIMSHKPWGLVMKEHHKWSKVPRSNNDKYLETFHCQ